MRRRMLIWAEDETVIAQASPCLARAMSVAQHSLGAWVGGGSSVVAPARTLWRRALCGGAHLVAARTWYNPRLAALGCTPQRHDWSAGASLVARRFFGSRHACWLALDAGNCSGIWHLATSKAIIAASSSAKPQPPPQPHPQPQPVHARRRARPVVQSPTSQHGRRSRTGNGRSPGGAIETAAQTHPSPGLPSPASGRPRDDRRPATGDRRPATGEGASNDARRWRASLRAPLRIRDAPRRPSRWRSQTLATASPRTW